MLGAAAGAAEQEAYDMPWYVTHDCPANPFTGTDTKEASV